MVLKRSRWSGLLGGMLCGLCLQACTSTSLREPSPVPVIPPSVPARPPGTQPEMPLGTPAQIPGQPQPPVPSVPSVPALPPMTQPQVPSPGQDVQARGRFALLLPLQSDALGQAAQAVRAGVMAAQEREPQGIRLDVLETGDSQADTLSGYALATADHDIVIGPLSRSGVTAVAQSGAIDRPTIALTQPEFQAPDKAASPKLLAIGLSIEDEARQVANWANKSAKKAYVLHTPAAWQRRAAGAFDTQWRRLGKDAEIIELPAADGFLNGRALLQLKKRLQGDKESLLFAALDVTQAKQLRAIMGNALPIYGTSQLNAFTLADQPGTERAEDLTGVRLMDVPWQLQSDHPAVMTYPKLTVPADQKRSPDIERLYALGIDAYRIARQIASGQTEFEVDGVTGRLKVRFDGKEARFERLLQPAIYRDGVVVPIDAASR
jgi:uncharacterized protein